jgi:hypothetical protein
MQVQTKMAPWASSWAFPLNDISDLMRLDGLAFHSEQFISFHLQENGPQPQHHLWGGVKLEQET